MLAFKRNTNWFFGHRYMGTASVKLMRNTNGWQARSGAVEEDSPLKLKVRGSISGWGGQGLANETFWLRANHIVKSCGVSLCVHYHQLAN